MLRQKKRCNLVVLLKGENYIDNIISRTSLDRMSREWKSVHTFSQVVKERTGE